MDARPQVIQRGPRPDWYPAEHKWNVAGLKAYCAERRLAGDLVHAFAALDAWNDGRSPAAQLKEDDAGLDPGARPQGTTSTVTRLFSQADFTAGDLIYGLSEHRDVLADRIGPKPSYYTVDDLNAHFLGVRQGQGYGTPNAPSVGSQATALTYRGSLEGFLETRGKPLTGVSGTGTGDVNTRLRRSSKFGVFWAAAAGKRIHFNLDQVDINRVIHKNHPNEDAPASLTDAKRRSITGAELRFIYRNWHLLSNAVTFYRNRIPVPAPWVENPTAWQGYTPKTTSVPAIVSLVAAVLRQQKMTASAQLGLVTPVSQGVTAQQNGSFRFDFAYDLQRSDPVTPARNIVIRTEYSALFDRNGQRQGLLLQESVNGQVTFQQDYM